MRIAILCVALTGCRAIVGIEDLTLTDGGSDATAADAKSDAPGDTGGPVDCRTGKTAKRDCYDCCVRAFGQGPPFIFARAAGGPCACTSCIGSNPPGECRQTTLCDGGASPEGHTCGGCVMGHTAENDPNCSSLATQCEGNPTCKTWLDCARTCGSLPPP